MHSASIKRPRSSRKLKMSDDNEEETPLGIRAPIVGYEVVDRREKFTVYKVQVRQGGKSWFVFRRYTDFVRLNDKLQDSFPGFHFKLPAKRWIKNNFDPDFIEERAHGLQFFINNIMRHTTICRSSIVKEFLCLDDPPGPFDSLEESRAYCQQLEDDVEDMKEKMMELHSELSATKSQLAQARVQQEALVQSLKDERASNSVRLKVVGDLPNFKSLSNSEGKEGDTGENSWTESLAIAAHSKSVNQVKPNARRRILTSTPDKTTDLKSFKSDDDLAAIKTDSVEKEDGLNTTLDDIDKTVDSSVSTVKESVQVNETSGAAKKEELEDCNYDSDVEIHTDVDNKEHNDEDNKEHNKSWQSSKRDSGIVSDTSLSPLNT